MTPDDLRQYLTRKLALERQTAQRMEDLYSGSSLVRFPDPKTLEALGARALTVPDNLGRLAIDVVTQFCEVAAYRSGVDDVVDNRATSIWREAGGPESSALMITDAGITGRGYGFVWADAAGNPTLTAESPLSVTVGRDPVSRRITSAIKRWRDFSGFNRTLLMTPDYIREYASRNAASPDLTWTFDATTLGEDVELVREEVNVLGVVPIVSLVNRPRTAAPDGESDMTDWEKPLTALAKIFSDLMVASEAGAIGRRVMLTPAMLTKDQAEQVQATMSATLSAPPATRVAVIGGGSDLKELGTADLQNFRVAIELLVGQIAALASLPDYYVNGHAAMPASAEAIRSSHARLTSKIKQRQQWFGPAFADMVRLLALVKDGHADPNLRTLETLWVDPAPRTVAESADAAVKLFASGVIDQRAALESLDYSPLEIERVIAAGTPNPTDPSGAFA